MKDNFSISLANYINHHLMPVVEQTVHNAPLDNATAVKVVDTVRSKLSQFLQGHVEYLSDRLKVSDQKLQQHITQAPIATPAIQSQHASLYGELAGMLLPAIAIATFFPMGLMAWLTTVAPATFILNKLGVGKQMKALVNQFGPLQQGKDAFIAAIRQELEDIQAPTCAKMGKYIDACLE